ncbi:MAG: AN1-type zinc finger domain-containing protein [Candidatus Bathyarchaeales archaeon]
MQKCEHCDKEVDLPFECKFCGGHYCLEHRLPETHNCPNLPPRTPLGGWQVKKELMPHSANSDGRLISKDNFARQENRAYPYKHENKKSRLYLHFKTLKQKKFLASFTFWFPMFWATLGFIYMVEANDPVPFYNNVPEPLRYAIYLFAVGIGGWTGYKIFDKLDIHTTSDRGLFGLNILSGVLFIFGIFLMVFGLFYQTGLFSNKPFEFTPSLARTATSVFIIVFSFALLITSAYLLFKFKRRSGIIVYRG